MGGQRVGPHTRLEAQLQRLKAYKANRSQSAVRNALDALAAAANSPSDNVYQYVVEAADAGVTHGEIVACVRKELGFGHPLVVA